MATDRAPRADIALVQQGLARSRSQAQQLIAAGQVSLSGEVVTKPSTPVPDSGQLRLAQADPWVSRAAHKLLGALDELGWEKVPATVLDAGASTGGFTQVLLSRGAQRVHAVDVGHDQLARELRDDPRVVNHEGLNLRELALEHLGEPVDLVVGDVSFISLTLLLAPLFAVLRRGPGGAAHPVGKALLMVKPQFEVGREKLGSSGVVRDQADRDRAVQTVVDRAAGLGWRAIWRSPSQLPGPAGNIEYFVLFEPDEPHAPAGGVGGAR